MAWVDKTAHIKPRRTFECDKCERQFEWREETPPDFCAICGSSAAEAEQIFGAPAVVGSATSKAVDYTWEMAQRDYGMTDMNSNLHEGDVAAKSVHLSTAQREQLAQETAEFQRAKESLNNVPPSIQAGVNGYWQGVGKDLDPSKGALAQQAATDRAQGVDALSIIQSRKAAPFRAINGGKQ